MFWSKRSKRESKYRPLLRRINTFAIVIIVITYSDRLLRAWMKTTPYLKGV